jgi:hypothetical protein
MKIGVPKEVKNNSGIDFISLVPGEVVNLE